MFSLDFVYCQALAHRGAAPLSGCTAAARTILKSSADCFRSWKNFCHVIFDFITLHLFFGSINAELIRSSRETLALLVAVNRRYAERVDRLTK